MGAEWLQVWKTIPNCTDLTLHVTHVAAYAQDTQIHYLEERTFCLGAITCIVYDIISYICVCSVLASLRAYSPMLEGLSSLSACGSHVLHMSKHKQVSQYWFCLTKMVAFGPAAAVSQDLL